MFSLAQASVSLRPLPPIPMQAMFNLLFRFWPRKSVGTPNASAPATSEVDFKKSRRLVREGKSRSAEFNRGNSACATEYNGRGGGMAGATLQEALLERPATCSNWWSAPFGSSGTSQERNHNQCVQGFLERLQRTSKQA
jgi:hypothetical protein